MKTGVLAVLALSLAACSGQVVTQSPTGSAAAAYAVPTGLNPSIPYCLDATHCPKPPGCQGRTCITASTQYTQQYEYADSSLLSPEEQKIEAQMEAELDAEIAANNAAAAAQQAAHR